MLKTIRSELGDLGWLLRMLGLAAVAGALYQELRRPPEERTWHGSLLGFVPYDFRVPTPAKVMNLWWNPKSKKLVGDPAFGVGWSLNLAAVADRLQSTGTTRKASASTRKTARKASA